MKLFTDERICAAIAEASRCTGFATAGAIGARLGCSGSRFARQLRAHHRHLLEAGQIQTTKIGNIYVGYRVAK